MKPLLALLLALIFLPAVSDAAIRVKDITSVQGVRENQLIGYGLVIGLQGTGDSMRNAPFTQQALQSMLDRLGVNIMGADVRVRNIAGVMVTASLPAFATTGSRLDVEISSIGDASSLKGGTLLMTPLSGADGKVYVVAQGALVVAGFAAGGQGATVSQGVPTDGRVPNGGLVEREAPGSLDGVNGLALELFNPDFKTATLISDTINRETVERYGKPLARERDMRSVMLERPAQVSTARFLAEIGDLLVTPDTPARVVINERTGTVVIGQDVQVSTVAMTHGTLTVKVTETPVASQPAPLSKGTTQVLPRTDVSAAEQDGHIAVVGGASLQALVAGLNQIGLKPTDVIAILQAIKSAGALQADLVVQ
jgi:flagellar P-ring protein precursor FlgI